MISNRIGQHIKYREFLLCQACDEYVSWPPGQLTDDLGWEIRTCPEGCGSQVSTVPRFWTDQGQATEWFDGWSPTPARYFGRHVRARTNVRLASLARS
ncbi:hypothetical protein [Nocardia sp. R7R-8]|uniref:hypothetical protein n=1 Tax=Nocardia sp. R7R-8 TaxID=3459304 RepID=UPI00403D7ED8